MKKLALNFICKDEGHIINQMLTSALPIADLIVAVDTGSKDNTILLIQAFGKKNDIPTYVFERPFDNFCNSRNYALDRLKKVVRDLGWSTESTWGFFIDCDEIIEFAGPFSKDKIVKDLYYTCLTDYETLYSRQFLFKLSKDFYWEGPIHETIQTDIPGINVGYLEGISVVFRPLGASWKGDVEKKYLTFTEKLIQYIEEGNRNFRWLFHTGESFSAAANACPSKERRQEWLRQALAYYQQANEMDSKECFETYVAGVRIAETRLKLSSEWNEIRETLLKAYAADKRHAEPLYEIIKHYTKKGQWETAYLFSSFAVANYHGKIPTGSDIGDIKVSVYQWELVLYHMLICSGSERADESRMYSKKLHEILKGHKARINQKERIMIQMMRWQERLSRYFPAIFNNTSR